MKILMSTFFHDNLSFSVFYDHLFKWFISNYPTEKTEVIFIMTQKFYDESKEYDLPDFCKKILMCDEEFFSIFGCKLIMDIVYQKVHYDGLSEDNILKLKNFMVKNCGGWEPDVIVTQGFCSTRKIWGDIYKKALYITNDNAIFSRPPFFRTLSYDVYEPSPNNFLVRYSSDLKNFLITKKQYCEVEWFKHKLTRILDKNNLIKKDIAKYKRKFKKLVLLPLVSDKGIKLFRDCLYDSEFNMIEDVLKHVPEDTGVCVTQHDVFRSLTDKDIEYFSSKYPNFIFMQKTNESGYTSNSLYYLKHVDAVFNTTSKTALMALLWDKPILSLAKLSNIYLEDGNGVEDIKKVLKLKKVKKNNILYWYFTHYCLFEPDMTTEGFMYKYFSDKIKYYKKHGIDFGYFNEINDFKLVANQVIEFVKKYYKDSSKQKMAEKQAELKIKLNKIIKKIIIIYKLKFD